MPRVRIKHDDHRFWLIYSPQQTVTSFVQEIRSQIHVSRGQIKLSVQDFEIPQNLTCEVLSQDDIIDVQTVADEDEDSNREEFGSFAPELPSLKRRKLSEATNKLAHIELEGIVPAYQTALAAVNPAAPSTNRPGLSRQDLLDFFSTAIEADAQEGSEDDGSFQMGATDDSSGDDSMSSQAATFNKETTPVKVSTSRHSSIPLHTTLDANGSPFYYPRSPNIRVVTPTRLPSPELLPNHELLPEQALTGDVNMEETSSEESSLSPEERAMPLDPIGALLEEAFAKYKADRLPKSLPHGVLSNGATQKHGTHSLSQSSKEEPKNVRAEPHASQKKPLLPPSSSSSAASSFKASSSNASDSEASSSAEKGASADGSSSEEESEELPPPAWAHGPEYGDSSTSDEEEIVEPTARRPRSPSAAVLDGVDATGMDLPMLYHPDIVKPEYHWVSKEVGYPVAWFPRLASASKPPGASLNQVPRGDQVVAWVNANRQLEVLQYLVKLDQNDSTKPHNKKFSTQPIKGAPFKGQEGTRKRNARRKKALRMQRQKVLGNQLEKASSPPNMTVEWEQMAQLQTQIKDGSVLAAEKAAALSKLESLQETVMKAIDAREEQPKMMSLTNKNKKKDFKQQMQGTQPSRILFPDSDTPQPPAKSSQSFSNQLDEDTLAFDLEPRQPPSNVTVSAVDVEADEFVPGEAQPNFLPYARSRVNGSPLRKPNETPSEWSGWMDLDQVARKFPLLARVRDVSSLSKGDRIAYQLLELSEDSLAPEYATYHGLLLEEPSFSVALASNLITTSTSQTAPEAEECYLKVKLHPSSIRDEPEVAVGWDDIADLRRLPKV